MCGNPHLVTLYIMPNPLLGKRNLGLAICQTRFDSVFKVDFPIN
jgi:hypothetical protein